MSNSMSPPRHSGSAEAIVDALFAKLGTFYGSLWLARWEDCPMPRVKAEWADALRGKSPQTLRLAVDHVRQNCPFPPTLPEFLTICRQFPDRSPAPLRLADRRDSPCPPEIQAQIDATLKRDRR